MDWEAEAQEATADIQEVGAAMTLRQTVSGEYDPVADTETTTTTDYPCSGLLKGVEFKLIDNTNILASDLMAVVGGSDLDVEPKPNDKWFVGTDQYTVIAWRPVRPGGVTILHKVVVRSA